MGSFLRVGLCGWIAPWKPRTQRVLRTSSARSKAVGGRARCSKYGCPYCVENLCASMCSSVSTICPIVQFVAAWQILRGDVFRLPQIQTGIPVFLASTAIGSTPRHRKRPLVQLRQRAWPSNLFRPLLLTGLLHPLGSEYSNRLGRFYQDPECLLD